MESSNETPHERFVRISPKRLRNAVDAIRTLGKLAHPYQYEATEADWAKIIERLRDELHDLEEAARVQVLSAERRAQRARKEEGVETEGFSARRASPRRPPWTAK